MSGALLDTSVLIAAEASDLPPTAAISVVTIGELHAGVLLAQSAGRREQRSRRLAMIRAAFAPIPVDEDIAERYGDVLALARSQGRTAKATDLLVIATAAASDRALYTLDRSQAELASAAGLTVNPPSETP